MYLENEAQRYVDEGNDYIVTEKEKQIKCVFLKIFLKV